MESYATNHSRPSRRSKSHGPKSHKIIILLIFIGAITATIFLLVQIFSHKIVIIPGKISYDESLADAEKSFLEENLADFRAPSDVTISATTEPTSSTKDNTLIYDVLVPVTDFYNATSNITSDQVSNYTLIPVSNLTPDQKLLSIDGHYYFDDYQNGAVYRTFHFDTQDSAAIIDALSEKLPARLTKDSILSINQTGVTALARAMQKTLNAVGDGAYFAEKVSDFLKSTDLTHISNEVSFASDCNVSASMTLCSDPRMFSAITAIGTDIVELTGNHNNDWGKEANLSTIKLYEDNNMQTFGGGKDEETPATPLNISEKGTNITWIGINYSTSSKENGQGASGANPGANIYNAATTKKQIAEGKERGDFIIVDVQYSECYSYPDEGQEMPECDYPISGQQAFFRQLVDEGADLVVGTQAHQPQTFEIYQDKPIYYGLGNLFFDQTYWPGTERSLVLTHYFKDGKLLQTRITPTMYGATYQPEILDETSAKTFLTRLISASPLGN